MNLEYEKKFLDDIMAMLRSFQPSLYHKMKWTGILAAKIGEAIGIGNPSYYLAGYYANIGMMGFVNVLQSTDLLDERRKEELKRHPVLAKEYLELKGLGDVASIVYAHHERPDGSGYYGLDNYPIESDYIHIADMFQGMITPKPYRPRLTFDEAIKLSLQSYENYLKISKENVAKIKEVLREFYDDMLTMY